MKPLVVGGGCFRGASKVACMKPFVVVGGGCFGGASKVSYMKPFGGGVGCFWGHQRFHT